MSANGPGQQPSGRSAARSLTGCQTCRRKKVKCGEERPKCVRCSRLELPCDYTPRPRKPYPARRRADRERKIESTARTSGSGSCVANPDTLSSPLNASHPARVGSFIIGPLERNALQYYQSEYSHLYHSKDARHNVFSMIYKLATVSDLVMHMVIAISNTAMLYMRAGSEGEAYDSQPSIMHYSAAIRKVAAYIDGTDQENSLDSVVVSIYLMLSYEQKFGDYKDSGLSGHLRGLASIIQTKSECCPLLTTSQNHYAPSTVKVAEMLSVDERNDNISLLAVRMLEWICVLDAGAASFGLGGHFNATVHQLLERDSRSFQRSEAHGQNTLLRGFAAMQSYTNQLSCRFWGSDYPIAALTDDIATNELYLLYGSCVQLRYLTSQMLQSPVTQSPAAHADQKELEDAFSEVFEQYTQYFVLADRLDADTDSSQRIVRDTRFIIPQYHAAFIFFLRCTGKQLREHEKRHQAIKTIVNLAFQSFQHEGVNAMLRIAWPLFMVTLETNNHFYRGWALKRLHSLGKYGSNYARAAVFAEAFTAEEQLLEGRHLDLWEHLTGRTDGKFAI